MGKGGKGWERREREGEMRGKGEMKEKGGNEEKNRERKGES